MRFALNYNTNTGKLRNKKNMKKLNNTEIGALASKIYKEINPEVGIKAPVSYHAIVKAKFEKTEDYKTLCKILKKYNVSTNPGSNFQFVLNDIIKKEVIDLQNANKKPAVKIIPLETIKNELIIAQIDSPDLTTLIETVKKSLKK